MKIPSFPRSIVALVASAALGFLPKAAFATSYASSLTNNSGTVSFRLNDAADSVQVTGNSDTFTFDLGPRARGLTTTNLTVPGLTNGVFKVIVGKIGSGAPSLIGGSIAFNSPRGVSVNTRPASPYFGRVYVANSAAGTKGDGLFAFSADLADILGQGTTGLTGGITNFAAGGSSSPMRVKVGRNDDFLYVTDWSDARGNLYFTDPNLTNSPVTSYALKTLTGTAAVPVGVANNHGSIIGVEVLGTLAGGDLKIYTIDEDYQTDPTLSTQIEDNSLWNYNVGSGPLPWGNAPDQKLLTPTINFTSQTMDLSYNPVAGYFYVAETRSAGNEAGIFVVDSVGNLLFNSRTESLAEGFSVDVLANTQGVAASPDGKYLATVHLNNTVTIIPLTNGIPNLPARFAFTGFGTATTSGARSIAFDAADNLYVASVGITSMQSLSLGITATNTTGSDGTFVSVTPATVVNAYLFDPTTTVTNILYEFAPTESAMLNIVRTNDDFSGPLTVNFTLTGTATRGTQLTGDYSIRTNGVVVTNANSVIIPAGSSNILVSIVANNDTTPELTETIIFTLSGGAYGVQPPLVNPLAIVDDETNMVDISAIPITQMFEGNTNDLVRYTLQRRGDTNVSSYDVNIKYPGGTAVSNVDYVATLTATIDPGVVTKTFEVHPIDDSIIESPETLIAAVDAGSSYLVGTNNALTAGATATIIDDDQPTETVLYSEKFDFSDTSTNWTVFYANTNIDLNPADYTATFAYDYAADNIPPAPHSSGDTLGLKLTVNKNGFFNAAGVNVYPLGQNFSGNFALRFDMFCAQNGSAGTTEYALFGINHSGTKTNWFRDSVAGIGGTPSPSYDGLWAFAEVDAANLGTFNGNAPTGDYGLLSSGVTTVSGITGPANLVNRTAASLAAAIHNPPYSAGGGSGALGNTPVSTTPTWAQVELSQIGKSVALKINNTPVLSYSNATAFTAGNIMLGYDDAFDSVGSGGGGFVIFDNVRVISLPAGIQITNVVKVGNNAQIDFTWFENDPASAFKLQSSATVAGPYADDNNAAIVYSVNQPAASYRVVAPATNNPARFFRIRHQ